MKYPSGWRGVLSKLRRNVPVPLVKTRTEHGKELEYIEWTTAADIADDVSPLWKASIKNAQVIDAKAVVTVEVSIYDEESGQWISRENIGSEAIDAEFGDPWSTAYAMAFKRALVLFGVGRNLYKCPEYYPHRVATADQIEQIGKLVDSGIVPDEHIPTLQALVDSGTISHKRADNIIHGYKRMYEEKKKSAAKSRKRKKATTTSKTPTDKPKSPPTVLKKSTAA